MRICLVSHEFAPFYGGGAGTYASVMSKALTDRGHEVHVVCADAGVVANGAGQRPRVKFHGLDWDEPPLNLPGFATHDVRQSVGVYERVKALHAQHPFDYIEFADFHAEGYHCLRAKRTLGAFSDAVLGVRLHIPLEELRAINDDPWIDREVAFNLPLENACIRDADVVFSPARAMLDAVRVRIPWAFSDESRPNVVVRNPFDETLLTELGAEPATVRGAPAKLPGADDAEVLFVGRLTHGKGADLLAAAARVFLAAHPRARLRMIGADTDTAPGRTSMLEHVRRVIGDELLRRVTIQPEHVPRQRLGPMIAAARVCVFPSRWENFPYACLEAMSLGAMVVGADAGGLAEIIEHERSGLLFRSGDVSSLAAMIGRGLTDDSLHAACSTAAPARVRELCEPGRIVAEVVDAVERVRAVRRTRVAAEARNESRGVAVIVAHAANDAAGLQRTLDAVARQSQAADEVLVVHPRGAGPEVETSAVEDRRVRCVAAEVDSDFGPRVMAALNNAGLRACASGHAAFLVPGDVLAPDFISSLCNAFACDSTLGFVQCHSAWGDGGAASEREGPVIHGLRVPLPPDRDLLCVTNMCGPALGLFDVDALRRVGGFNEALAPFEDWALFCALSLAGVAGAVVPEILVTTPSAERDAVAMLDRRQRELLRASILRTYPTLPEAPGRALRFMAAECGPLPASGDRSPPVADAHVIAERLIAERLRYRIADRVNTAVKRTKWHGVLRRWMDKK